MRQFAQRLGSTPGKKDGLYWDADESKGEELSPLGPLLNGPLDKVLGKTDLCYKLMPKMIESAAVLAQQRAMQIVAASLSAMQEVVGGEIERLRDQRLALWGKRP